MVKCKLCKKEMSNTDSCINNKTITYSDGTKLLAIKYRAPTIKELENSLKSFNNPKFTESLKNKLTAGIKSNIEFMKKNPSEKLRCHDCNVQDGVFHHQGCDSEICPKCKGQLITCNCEKM